jgi:AAA ATPase domain
MASRKQGWRRAAPQLEEAPRATRGPTGDRFGGASATSDVVVGSSAAAQDADGSSPFDLVGREAECGRLRRLVSAAREGRGGSLLLMGESGIGKSALCAWAVREAGDLRIVAARGVEAEADLPFAGLTELCADQLGWVDALPVSQADALKRALALHASPGSHRLAVGAAVLSLLSFLGEQAPVLGVIDDMQ